MKTKSITLEKDNKKYYFYLVVQKADQEKIKRRVLSHLTKNPFETLHDYYNSFSYEKEKSYDNLIRKCLELNAELWGVLSANSCFYSFGFTFELNNKNYVCLETHCNSYLVEV